MKNKSAFFIAFILGVVLPMLLLRTMPTVEKKEYKSFNIRVLNENKTEIMDINDYLVGVLLYEMPGDFELDALRAQAVAARTFALYDISKHESNAVCTESICCQGYISPDEYLSAGGSVDVVTKMIEAVRSTDGEVLVYNGNLIEATYFSSAGGRTERAVDVWGEDVPYLQSVESEEGDRTHTTQIALKDFCVTLGIANAYLHVDDVTHTYGGGIESITINGKTFTGTQLRKVLGLRSTQIEFQFTEDSVIVTTRGYGHRVGMSQYGANAMALEGTDYIDILEHYYTGTLVCRYNDNNN